MTCCTYSWFPHEFFGIFEWIMGLIIGIWLPLLRHTRNNDCFYAFFSFSINTLWDWMVLFDYRYEWLPEGDWCVLGHWCSTVSGWENFILNAIKPFTTVLGAYSTQNLCLR